MKNTISLRKKWEDNDLLWVEASIASENIAIEECYYTSKTKLKTLQAKLDEFLKYPGESFSWSSGIGVQNEVPVFSFKFEYADTCGHIKIEVTVEVDDGGEGAPYHMCCFNVYSEIGLMDVFCQELNEILASPCS